MARRRAAPGIDGVCVVDKEPGWTSHDVVAKARGILGTAKIGHAGTLDPGATGVLVLGVGVATRLLRYVTDTAKSYVGEMVLGTTTTTLDADGEVIGRFDMAGVAVADVRVAAAGFVGEIDQIPPMVSALKVGGRRLHELAREGIEVERVARRVVIGRIDVDSTDEPGVFRLTVDCGSGTYIRSLASDLGTALGGGAHLRHLRRTAVGAFTVADARAVDSISVADLLPVRRAVGHLEVVELDDTDVARVRHGQRLSVSAGRGAGPWAMLGPDGSLVAVGEAQGEGAIRPAVVLPTPP